MKAAGGAICKPGETVRRFSFTATCIRLPPMTASFDDACAQVARWIVQSTSTVVFSGAGISTESGIPDFRSPGGVWSRYDPEDYTFQNFIRSHEKRSLYWQRSNEMFDEFHKARPNAGHEVVAAWEKAGLVQAVITQNIDGLHQRAGSRNVIEIHGTAMKAVCLECGRTWPMTQVMDWVRSSRANVRDYVPYCEEDMPGGGKCGGPIKSATISFGQSMPEKELMDSFSLSRNASLFIVLGSSLVVQPAAQLPLEARRAGAKLVIITASETPLDGIADARFFTPIGQTLSAIAEQAGAMRN